MVEFVEFKRRLEQSHALAVAKSEQSLMKIKQAIPNGLPAVQSALQETSRTLTPISGMSQVSELPSLEHMRFNEDLSTRPAWLAPFQGSVGGALLEWWQHQQQAGTSDTGANTGYVCCASVSASA